MSWQRIDENTFIDDTLVTCAEYQLFIDEMREQGEYYQPVHWTSYQFPVGHSQKLILGIGLFDAIAFCQWLTQRRAEDWRYRLPNQNEEYSFSINPFELNPLGYWIAGAYEFAWVGTVPKDARDIPREITLARPHEIADARYEDYQLSVIRGLKRFEDWHDFNQAFDRAIERAIERSRHRALALKRVQDLRFALEDALSDAFKRADELGNRLPLADNIVIISDRILEPNLGSKFRRTWGRLIYHLYRQVRARTLLINHDRELDSMLDSYIDLVTLQERIAGRSPAFEGIRLVKERIR
jgi:hypothetical protein